ncbi:MAG: B12-binding domain-containing radical SAM protein, partial [Planctomycetaceae bacterium]
NLGELRQVAEIAEFTINDQLNDVLAEIVRLRPEIVGIGVYIWNIDAVTRLVADLRRVLPDTWLVLGGPEVSWETDQQPVTALADYVITGEADHAFRELCERLLANDPPPDRVIAAGIPDLSSLVLPYAEYSAEDIANRVIYVEASRGCPFTCEFCLSALDIP